MILSARSFAGPVALLALTALAACGRSPQGAGAGAGAGSGSCAAATNHAAQGRAGADRSCKVDADCAITYTATCPAREPAIAVCAGWQCADALGSDGVCTECLAHEFSLEMIDPASTTWAPKGERYLFSGCNTFTLTTADGRSCSRPIPRCSGIRPGWDTLYTVAVLNEALRNGLYSYTRNGVMDPPEAVGPSFAMTLDGERHEYDSCNCSSAQPYLDDLVSTAYRLVAQLRCQPGGSPDCTSEFEAGPVGAGGQLMAWHDPRTKTCLERTRFSPETWGEDAAAANHNRYATPTLCEQDCPPPRSAADCGAGRIFEPSVCLACETLTRGSQSGSCTRRANRCTKSCTTDADCAGEVGDGGSVQVPCDEGACRAPAPCVYIGPSD